MFGFGRPSTLPDAADALPGRDAAIPTAERHFVNGSAIQPPYPAGAELATFGMGCFWGAEKLFWQTEGVLSTSVGYAGGYTPNPTYEEVCSGFTNHTEAVLVVFDPKQVSYEQLLKVFWEGHDPSQGMRQGNDRGTQYRSAIYWADEAQHAAGPGPEGRRRARASRVVSASWRVRGARQRSARCGHRAMMRAISAAPARGRKMARVSRVTFGGWLLFTPWVLSPTIATG